MDSPVLVSYFWDLVEKKFDREWSLSLDSFEGFDEGRIATLYETNLTRLLETNGQSRSHDSLRPDGISFGAYGDLSWNTRHNDIESALASAPGGDPQLPDRMDEMRFIWRTQVMEAGSAIRRRWSRCLPRVHCTRLFGGPMGCHGQYVLQWPVNAKPEVTILHCYQPTPLEIGITVGNRNIIIYHDRMPVNLRVPHEGHPLRRFNIYDLVSLDLGVWQELEEGKLDHEDIVSTAVEVYGAPGFTDETPEQVSIILEAVRKDFGTRMTALKGCVSFYALEGAPACPCCG